MKTSNLMAMVAGALLVTTGLSPAQDAEANRILERYEELRPVARDLAMYQLDWAGSPEVALARAAREKRPVCLIIIHAQYGDIFSGHC